jgi:hypothetical protein
MNKSWMLAFALVYALLGGCAPLERAEFAVYLVAQDMPAGQITQVDLDEIELQSEPLLATDDIVFYDRDTHEVLLSQEACERIEHTEVTTAGRPFVVCVGQERIYGGAIWPMFSSYSFDGVVIEVPLMGKRSVQFRRGYPSPQFFRGPDRRGDARILNALERFGKLM